MLFLGNTNCINGSNLKKNWFNKVTNKQSLTLSEYKLFVQKINQNVVNVDGNNFI